MNSIECETCIKRKTMYCPNSAECFDSENKLHYQSRIMLLEENEQLKVNYKAIDEAMSKLMEEIKQLKDVSEDRLDVILKLVKELKKYKKLSYKYLLEKNNKLKSVLDEIREYIEKHKMVDYDEFEYISTSPKAMLQILDKVKE